MNDSGVLVLKPHPTLEYVISGHSGHFLVSLLILNGIACRVRGAELTMTADFPAGRDGCITNPRSISAGLCKGTIELVTDSFLAIFLSINSWDRDNERVLVARIGVGP